MKERLDFTQQQVDFLPVKFRNGLELEIAKPTLNILSKLQKAAESSAIGDVLEAITAVINNNRQKQTLKMAEVDEMMTIDDLYLLANAIVDFCQPPKN